MVLGIKANSILWLLRAAVLFVMVMALVACEQDPGSANAEEEAEETPAIPVEIALPTRGDIFAVYSGTAPVEAFAEAAVIAKVGGEVLEILVEEGDRVTNGQVLARLDGDRLRFEMQQAEANLRKLQRDYQRNVDLKERGIISLGEFEKIKYEMKALEATFNLAKLELSYTEIKAPIDGVVSHRYIKIGNTIAAEAPTFQITSLEPLVSYLYVPERAYRHIEAGQSATIHVDALQGTTFDAIVARTSPVVDAATGTFKVTVEVTDPTQRLRPGMFGRIDVVYDKHANALQVPRSAIVQETGESTVFVVVEGTAHRRAVETGYVGNGQIEILKGLTDTDKFVLVGQAGLKEGSKVAVINPAAAAEAPVSASSSPDN